MPGERCVSRSWPRVCPETAGWRPSSFGPGCCRCCMRTWSGLGAAEVPAEEWVCSGDCLIPTLFSSEKRSSYMAL